MATLMRSLLVAATEQRDRNLADGLADLHMQLELRGVGLLDFDTAEPVAEKGYNEAFALLTVWQTAESVAE
jgi:hypothetical protein